MDFYTAPDDQQLGLWQPQTREQLWGSVWYWIWLSEHLEANPDNPKG
jgi:hypothetical protein